jgi:hypothetical protein
MQPGQEDPYNPQQPPTPPGSYPPPSDPAGSYPPPGAPGSYPPPPPGGYPPPGYGPGPAGPNNTQGLAGMILGILSIPLACCPYLGIVLGILGGVLSYLGRKKADEGLATNRGQAQAGLICSAVGLVLGIIILILGFAFRNFDWTTYFNR